MICVSDHAYFMFKRWARISWRNRTAIDRFLNRFGDRRWINISIVDHTITIITAIAIKAIATNTTMIVSSIDPTMPAVATSCDPYPRLASRLSYHWVPTAWAPCPGGACWLIGVMVTVVDPHTLQFVEFEPLTLIDFETS